MSPAHISLFTVVVLCFDIIVSVFFSRVEKFVY